MAEEHLNKNEDKFWKIFNVSRAGFQLSHRPGGEIIEINDSYLKMIGYERAEVIGRTSSEIGWLDGVDRQKMLDRFRVTQSLEDYEINFTKKSGEKGTALISATTLEFNGGPCILFTVWDISQRKQMERQIQESEEKFRTVFNMSQAGIALVHYPTGKFVEINDTYLKMIEYTREEVIGRTSVEVGWFAAAERQQMIDTFYKGERRIRDYEISFTKKSGKKGMATISYDPIVVNHENYMLVSIQDITQRVEADKKKTELLEQLEQANKDLEAFAFTVSHDLRSPLRGVSGYLQILERKPSVNADEGSKQIIELVKNEAARMKDLIDDLLAFSRQSKAELTKAPVDMTALARSALEGLKTDPHSDKVIIHDLLPAYGDSAALKQVFVNFISNALKYSAKKPDPMIEVNSYKEGDEHIYFVKDNGAGFDMKYYDQLFQVFHRLHSRTDFEGNGVGLAIVSKIVSKHGGRVWATGEVGVGATFYFSLPAQQKNS